MWPSHTHPPSDSRSRARLTTASLALVVATAAALAACTAPAQSGAPAPTTAEQLADASSTVVGGPDSPRSVRAAAAAQAAAGKLGGPVTLPHEKVGFLQLNAQAEVAARIEQGARAASAVIGWEFVSCDSQGDPARMASCGSSLLNQDVDVVLSVAIEPTAITAQLQAARARNVPWITVGGGTTPNPLFSAEYAPLETEMAGLIDSYLLDRLAGGPRTIAISTFSSVRAGKARSDTLRADLAGSNVTIVDEHEDDLANQIADARQSVTAQLTAHPEVAALLGTADYSLPVMGQVVAAKFPGTSFPDRPLVLGYLDDLVNLEAIRSGQADALATMRLDTESWIAVDQVAELFARGRALQPDAYLDSLGTYGLDFHDASLITRENLPAPGRYVQPLEDFQTFFTTKWRTEFGVGRG